MRLRWLALAAALAAWAVLQVGYATIADAEVADWVWMVLRPVRELQAWTAIVAAIGFAHRHLRTADGPARRLLTQAIFPFYLIHQTIIVVAGHHLDNLGLPLLVEAPLLLGATALGCWAFYDLGRRIPPLRVWVGLPSKNLQFRARSERVAAGETG